MSHYSHRGCQRSGVGPYVRGPIQLITEWAAIFPEIEPKALAEAWVKMEDHIEAPGGKAWAKVRGPMGATHMHLEEMGR